MEEWESILLIYEKQMSSIRENAEYRYKSCRIDWCNAWKADPN
jgi:hypothetical protein